MPNEKKMWKNKILCFSKRIIIQNENYGTNGITVTMGHYVIPIDSYIPQRDYINRPIYTMKEKYI